MSTVRKLSLRSKTMISSAMEKTKAKTKTLTRHKSVEEKRLFSNTFSLLPHHKTPPLCSKKVLHNPFEKDLSGRLGKSIFSPDVFENVVSPSEVSRIKLNLKLFSQPIFAFVYFQHIFGCSVFIISRIISKQHTYKKKILIHGLYSF